MVLYDLNKKTQKCVTVTRYLFQGVVTRQLPNGETVIVIACYILHRKDHNIALPVAYFQRRKNIFLKTV